MENMDGDGVFQLLTELCHKASSKYSIHSSVSPKRLMTKLRSNAYEIILKKSTTKIPVSPNDPITDLLSYYFMLKTNLKSVAEYKKITELKKLISLLKRVQDNRLLINNVLKFLVALKGTGQEDLSIQMYQSPFTFGLLDEMLPRPPREKFGAPQPYQYYPSHVFVLPFSLRKQLPPDSASQGASNQNNTPYIVESFDSRSYLPNNIYSQTHHHHSEVKMFTSPMSIASFTTSYSSPYSKNSTLLFSRLTAPRDLKLPTEKSDTDLKISLASSNRKSEIKVVFRAPDNAAVDIWEIASRIDKELPENIWEIVSKMPPKYERQLIASSSRELRLWRQKYKDVMSELHIVSEKLFICHVMYLTIGVETYSFPFSKESNSFYMRENLILECISRDCIEGYVVNFLLIGTYYKRLFSFAFNQTLDDNFYTNGLIYEAARDVIRQYLLEFRLKATEIYGDCFNGKTEQISTMPTLLKILHHLEPIQYELETIASIYKMTSKEPSTSIPCGAELMSYMFKEISMISHKRTASTMFRSLITICEVYFKFIERFIFEGELDDKYREFFIRKDSQYVNSRSKLYWDKGFYITQSVTVPDFLRVLAKCILLCGKSLRLLKLCNPTDPLVVLISSDHPSVKCCGSFEELEQQQEVLDVYRTRCLFVSGEPATFEQILLKKEAERKACTEMASIKQAETIEKILAERKRLAQLIIAEKQHFMRVLEAAIAANKAERNKVRQKEKLRYNIEQAVDKSREEVDAKLRDEEKTKIKEYYSKLNMEVEKSKIHSEWKIKRLQLDQSRIQLLSTEERNLKREKLELEHQRNEEIMAMSIQSLDGIAGDDSAGNNFNTNDNTAIEELNSTICSTGNSIYEKHGTNNEYYLHACDNQQKLDPQGNVVSADSENNSTHLNSTYSVPSYDCQNNFKNVLCVNDNFYEEAKRNKMKVLGSNFNIDAFTSDTKVNEPRTEAQRDALINKQKVLGIEYNIETQPIKNEPANVAQEEAICNKNKMLSSKYLSQNENATLSQNSKNNNYSYNIDNILKLGALSREDSIDKLKMKQETLNEAQEEAVRNKKKILGSDCDQDSQNYIHREPMNEAQEEAVRNKKKILGSDCDQDFQNYINREPMNEAQEEAVRNKKKILGSDCDQDFQNYINREPMNEAQEEAVRNKKKILGSDCDQDFQNYIKREPMNEAQEEAVRNRKKILGSDYDKDSQKSNYQRQSDKRADLKLNLNSFNTNSMKGDTFTPIAGGVTPAEFFPRLDLETPTADVPIGIVSHNILTNDDTMLKNKPFLSSEGFNFSSLIVDEEDSGEISDVVDSKENSPYKNRVNVENMCNSQDDVSRFDDFDPFGVKHIQTFSQSDFTNKHKENSTFFYTHPAYIMREVQKKPYKNIFRSKGDKEKPKPICDNVATLIACLQRSVMLPLTYQLEVVNNSILTHFLINLDMYEHLRSLKDYFFLMDGEFSKSICHNLFVNLVKTINPQDLLNFSTLHNILDKALGSSISHVHKFSENLSFTITEVPLSFHHSSPDVLQCLSLTYSVTWPLNIILSQETLLRYSKVFQFLVKMRLISWVLGQDFEVLKQSVKLSSANSRKLLQSPHYRTIQIYRHIMASLIRALDNYIVTTCILTSWTEFEDDLKKARTLDDLYDCHVVYIKKVLFRCLLNNRSTLVMKLLNDIFTVILKYNRVLKNGKWLQKDLLSNFTHQNFNQLEELFQLFAKLAKYLQKVILRLTECGYQRHLLELLTIININGYYDLDKTKDAHNSSVESS